MKVGRERSAGDSRPEMPSRTSMPGRTSSRPATGGAVHASHEGDLLMATMHSESPLPSAEILHIKPTDDEIDGLFSAGSKEGRPLDVASKNTDRAKSGRSSICRLDFDTELLE